MSLAQSVLVPVTVHHRCPAIGAATNMNALAQIILITEVLSQRQIKNK